MHSPGRQAAIFDMTRERGVQGRSKKMALKLLDTAVMCVMISGSRVKSGFIRRTWPKIRPQIPALEWVLRIMWELLEFPAGWHPFDHKRNPFSSSKWLDPYAVLHAIV